MEFLRGGPLLDDLHHIAGESYTEQQAAVIAAQVMQHHSYKALSFTNTVHR